MDTEDKICLGVIVVTMVIVVWVIGYNQLVTRPEHEKVVAACEANKENIYLENIVGSGKYRRTVPLGCFKRDILANP